MNMASTTRNVSMSLQYRLWQLMYQWGWYYSDEAAPLASVSGDGVPPYSYSYSIDNGYPWVFWDANTKNPSLAHITVYRNGVPVSPAIYAVDFAQGRISFKSQVTGAISADVSHFTFHLTEGYPDKDRLEMLDLPIIAYEVEGKRGSPFAIGTVARDWSFPVTIDILAQDDGQRKDLLDSITYGLLRMPFFDMAGAWLLTPQGDINTSFNADIQRQGILRVARDPDGRMLPPRQGGSDKERWRAMVTAEFRVVE